MQSTPTRSSSTASRQPGAAQQPGMPDDTRENLLNEAIGAFRTMLIEEPRLLRVRLELARAFYLKGEEELARRHFELVLAADPPEPVVANVRRFLAELQARRRWSYRLGAALAPDSNIGGTSRRADHLHLQPALRA